MSGRGRLIGIGVLLGTCAAGPVWADHSRAPDLRKGVFYGTVVDAASGKPVPHATVAVEDRHGKVIAWTHTDDQGRYAVAADTVKLLQIPTSHHRGLFGSLIHDIGSVVTAPVKLAGEAVSGAAEVVREVNPIDTARATAVSALTANPAPVASQITSATLSTLTSKAEKAARLNAAKMVLGERLSTPTKGRSELLPDEVWIVADAPDHQPVRGQAGAYWLEPPTESKEHPVGTRAWLETVSLAPDGSSKKSAVEKMAVLLTAGQIDPALAPAGTPVKLQVKLQTPGGQPLNVRVFAREDRRHTVVELKPQGGGVFAGELRLDPKLSPGDTTISVVALRAAPIGVDLPDEKAAALLSFVADLDALNPDKPYEYDPRIMASENRLDLKVTVLDPEQTAPPIPVAMPTPPASAPLAAPAQQSRGPSAQPSKSGSGPSKGQKPEPNMPAAPAAPPPPPSQPAAPSPPAPAPGGKVPSKQ